MRYFRFLFCLFGLLLAASCNTTRHVGEGQYLLNKVSVTSDNKNVKSSELKSYVRQEPNHKTFGLVGLPLFFYNLSGDKDTRWNRWLRKVGTPPVIYDPDLTEKSRLEITKALRNRGYENAVVTVDTIARKKKMKVRYQVKPGKPYHIENITYNISNDSIARIILADTSAFLLKKGAIFDRNLLEQERQRISTLLRNRGYYAFNKEYITYTADTTSRNYEVDLELNLMPPLLQDTTRSDMVFSKHEVYHIRNVYFMTDYNPMNIEQDLRFNVKDTVDYKGFRIFYGNKKYLTPATLVENCYIRPGMRYSNRAVDNTFSAFGRLRVVKYVNIQFHPLNIDGDPVLDCYILLTEGKPQTISVDVEGTNSAGDLGFALGLTHQHRNMFHGSETFTTKLRAAYESLSGDLGGLLNDNYLELGAEVGISFPKFLFPFVSPTVRRRMRATTEFTLNFNYQQRPEYTRVIAGGGWNYKWYSHNNMYRHHLDLVDISYIYLPKTTERFISNLDSIASSNPLLRYSYENHFIMRSSYVFYQSNLRPGVKKVSGNIYTLRAAGEIAGNLLYGISKLTRHEPGEYGEYSILGIRYAQYAKADLDYAYTILLNERNSLALHVGAGIAVPYGNSEMVPFEKRYFSGGANSVRGWSVRGLGPGRYRGTNPMTDFMNQCGDIRLDMNAEYRSKLIWKLELAAFLDAGNIWTIRNYPSQPGGKFQLKSFYKEIAMAYGLGMRLDFNYFILRLDLGMKLYDPSVVNKSKWVISYQNFNRDATLHFAVGYPF